MDGGVLVSIERVKIQSNVTFSGVKFGICPGSPELGINLYTLKTDFGT